MMPPNPINDEVSLLLLHTSCTCSKERLGKEPSSLSKNDDYLSSCGEDADNKNIFGKPIDELSVVCNVLILPENTKNNNDDNGNTYIELLDTKFNPCGLSNVLTLRQDVVPSSRARGDGKEEDGGLLLSLTSCRINVGGENRRKQNLPVEPFPSTFDFTFQNDNSATTKMAELTVQFDLSLARRLAKEDNEDGTSSPTAAGYDVVVLTDTETPVLRNTNASLPVTEEESHKVNPARESCGTTNDTDPYEHEERRSLVNPPPCICEECDQNDIPKLLNSFYLDMCFDKSEGGGRNIILEQPDRSLFDQRLEELLHLQERLDRESDNLNFLFGLLSMMGLFLLGTLFWILFRLYFGPDSEVRKTSEGSLLSLCSKLQLLLCDTDGHLPNDHQGQTPLELGVHGQETRTAYDPLSPLRTRREDEEDLPCYGLGEVFEESEGRIEPVCLDSILQEAADESTTIQDAEEKSAGSGSLGEVFGIQLDCDAILQEAASSNATIQDTEDKPLILDSSGEVFGIQLDLDAILQEAANANSTLQDTEEMPLVLDSSGEVFGVQLDLDSILQEAAEANSSILDAAGEEKPSVPDSSGEVFGILLDLGRILKEAADAKTAILNTPYREKPLVPKSSEGIGAKPQQTPTSFVDPVGLNIQDSGTSNSSQDSVQQDDSAPAPPLSALVEPVRSSPPRISDQNSIETKFYESQKLSPCSRFAQEWAAKKTLRRHNRKSKQPLQPPQGNVKENFLVSSTITSCLHENTTPITPPRAAESQKLRPNTNHDEQYVSDNIPVFQDDPSDLSPCTKLAHDWASKKTVRRNNRRRKHNLLQPHPRRNNDLPIPSDFSGEDLVIGPPSVRSFSNGEEFSPQTMVMVPSAEEILAERKITEDSSNSPAPQSLPDLCTTPTSGDGDDSFIDDYW